METEFWGNNAQEFRGEWVGDGVASHSEVHGKARDEIEVECKFLEVHVTRHGCNHFF
jgi:hypothetical protein